MKSAEFTTSLELLERVVAEASGFFARFDEQLPVGRQTARQCLAHLVFWHREYLSILRALAQGRAAELRSGTFASLNAEAYREFAAIPMSEMACQLESLQRELDSQLRVLLDPQMEVLLKQMAHSWQLAELIPRVAGHIRGHTRKFQAAEKRCQKAAQPKEAGYETQN